MIHLQEYSYASSSDHRLLSKIIQFTVFVTRQKKSHFHYPNVSIDINICKFKLCDRITKSGGILHQFVIIVKYVDSGGYENVK